MRQYKTSSKIMWAWIYNGAPSIDELYGSPEAAMERIRSFPDGDDTIEGQIERNVELGRVRVTVEVLSALRPIVP
jgi:hypothetical protein